MLINLKYRVIVNDELFELLAACPFIPRTGDIIVYPHESSTLRLQVSVVSYEDDCSNIRVGLEPTSSTLEDFEEEDLVKILMQNGYKLVVSQEELAVNEPSANN